MRLKKDKFAFFSNTINVSTRPMGFVNTYQITVTISSPRQAHYAKARQQ